MEEQAVGWEQDCLKWMKQSNFKYWANTGLLNDLADDPYYACVVSLMLENQRIWVQDEDRWEGMFEMVSEIMSNLIVPKIVSVQPMIGPTVSMWTPKIRYVHENLDIILEEENKEMSARTRKARSQVDMHFPDNDRAVKDIIKEINMEVITDLKNNCGTETKVKADCDDDTLYGKVCQMSGVLHRKTLLNFKKWMLVSRAAYDQHKKLIDNMRHPYTIHVIEDTGSLKWIVMGSKGERPIDSPYVWSPYVMLMKTPAIIDPESFNPRKGFLIRYAKRLSNPKFYGKITWETVEKR